MEWKYIDAYRNNPAFHSAFDRIVNGHPTMEVVLSLAEQIEKVKAELAESRKREAPPHLLEQIAQNRIYQE